jgi:DNA-binding transcriptional ArsR family regulator
MERFDLINDAPELDAVFAALADPTRRAMLARLAQGPASVGELAAPFDMSQPAISKHLKSLERAGLISRRAEKQKRMAVLNAAPMGDAVTWLTEFRDFWGANFTQLDALLRELQAQERGRED